MGMALRSGTIGTAQYSAASATLTVTLGATPTNGDVIVAHMTGRFSNENFSPPGGQGWVERVHVNPLLGRTAVYTRVWSTSDPTAYTFTTNQSATAHFIDMGIAAFSGVDTTTDHGVEQVLTDTNEFDVVAIPAITPVATGNGLVFGSGRTSSNADDGAPTHSSGEADSELWDTAQETSMTSTCANNAYFKDLTTDSTFNADIDLDTGSDCGAAPWVVEFLADDAVFNPAITDVETDEDFDDKDTSVTITGTDFETPKGSGKVEISDNATYATGTKVEQTTTSWAVTSINFTANLSTLSPGPLWLWVTNNSSNRNAVGFVITVHRAQAFKISASSNIAAGGEATTALLAAPSGKDTGDFGTGRIWDNENGSDSINIPDGDYTELEWCMQAVPNSNLVQYDFRVVYNDGTALDVVTVTAKATVASIVAKASTDTLSAASDTGAADAAISSTDSASGSDSASLDTAISPTNDSASGSDNAIVAAAVSNTDVGAGSDSAVLSLTASDASSGADNAATDAVISDADTGTGSDNAVLAAVIPVTDSVLGSDVTTLVAVFVITDAAAGSDNGIILVVIGSVDVGSGSDLAALGVVDTDTGSGTDNAGLAQIGIDVFAGLDTSLLAAVISDIDSGTGTDSAIVTFVVIDTDAVNGSDDATLAVSEASSDSASGTEPAITLTAVIQSTDTGLGDETASLGGLRFGTDVATGSDNATLVADGINGIDSGSGVDDGEQLDCSILDFQTLLPDGTQSNPGSYTSTEATLQDALDSDDGNYIESPDLTSSGVLCKGTFQDGDNTETEGCRRFRVKARNNHTGEDRTLIFRLYQLGSLKVTRTFDPVSDGLTEYLINLTKAERDSIVEIDDLEWEIETRIS